MTFFFAFATAFAWLCLPGYLALVVLRARIPFRFGVAPAASAAVLALVGFALAPLGIAWSPLSAGVGSGLVIAVLGALAWVAHRRSARAVGGVARGWSLGKGRVLEGGRGGGAGAVPAGNELRPTCGRLPAAPHLITWLGVIAAGLIYAVPIATGGLGLNSISSAFDAVFHYNSVAFIRADGHATPWTALASMYGSRPTFYPVGLHLVASLVAGEPVVAANATVFVALCLAGAPLASLCWLVVPVEAVNARGAAIIATLVPASTLFFSIASMVLISGLWPNALGAVVFPGIVAAILSAFTHRVSGVLRDASWCVASILPAGMAMAGGTLVHPSVAFGIGIVVWALLAAHTVVLWSSRPRSAVVLGLVLVAIAVGYDVVASTFLRSMALTPKIEMAPFATVLTLLADRPRLTAVPLNLAYVLGVYALAGIAILVVLVRRSHSRMRMALVIMFGVTFVVALGTAYSFLPLSSLANPWYQARERVLPMMTTALVPLAVFGAIQALEFVRAKRRTWGTGFLVLMILVAGGHAALNGVSNERIPKLVKLASDSSDGYLTNTVSEDERVFIESSSTGLGRDAVVLGDPRDGAAMYWALGGVDVVFPHLGRPATPTDRMLAQHADEYWFDPDVCQAITAHGDNVYFYEDHSTARRDDSSPESGDREEFGGLSSFPKFDLKSVAKSPDGTYELSKLDMTCPSLP